LLDEELLEQLSLVQGLLQEILEFQASISSQEMSPRDAVAGAVRSQLQIELILRSLSPSSAKPQVKALL